MPTFRKSMATSPDEKPFLAPSCEESETLNQHASKPVLTDPEWFRTQVNDVIRNSVIIETLGASEDAI